MCVPFEEYNDERGCWRGTKSPYGLKAAKIQRKDLEKKSAAQIAAQQ